MSRYPEDLKSILQSVVRKKIYNLILSQNSIFSCQSIMDALQATGTVVEKKDLEKFLMVLQARDYVKVYRTGRASFTFKLGSKFMGQRRHEVSIEKI